jgi:hypothetical protein
MIAFGDFPEQGELLRIHKSRRSNTEIGVPDYQNALLPLPITGTGLTRNGLIRRDVIMSMFRSIPFIMPWESLWNGTCDARYAVICRRCGEGSDDRITGLFPPFYLSSRYLV